MLTPFVLIPCFPIPTRMKRGKKVVQKLTNYELYSENKLYTLLPRQLDDKERWLGCSLSTFPLYSIPKFIQKLPMQPQTRLIQG